MHCVVSWSCALLVGGSKHSTLWSAESCCDVRGPEQLARSEEGQGGMQKQEGTISEDGRAALREMMKEGLGDHILMLRLFQVLFPHMPASSEAHSPSFQVSRSASLWALDASVLFRHPSTPAMRCPVLALQAWEESGWSVKWCKGMGLDARGMHFAREVRKQLVELCAKSGIEQGGPPTTAEDSRAAKRRRRSPGV
jgi:hypothetical protein